MGYDATYNEGSVGGRDSAVGARLGEVRFRHGVGVSIASVQVIARERRKVQSAAIGADERARAGVANLGAASGSIACFGVPASEGHGNDGSEKSDAHVDFRLLELEWEKSGWLLKGVE